MRVDMDPSQIVPESYLTYGCRIVVKQTSNERFLHSFSPATTKCEKVVCEKVVLKQINFPILPRSCHPPM